ncbi:SH3 domain-containing protein [Pontibacter sp. G13]|uniref:SH3 domain-containing protein n=1 Tax=Pontibacter sp. G13 TaxID=3074898 RepID=UPI002889DFB6|nr:SH3 domain-containing protein [Pontibacter sp. G13]WNJ17313.1 SH3 domain-containing protein [Pontibacter sp. G13]
MNLKTYLFFCWSVLLLATATQAQRRVGVIQDPDGYSNLRSGKGSSFDVLTQIYEGNHFFTWPSESDPWWKVETARGKVGYMHKSRILLTDKKCDCSGGTWASDMQPVMILMKSKGQVLSLCGKFISRINSRHVVMDDFILVDPNEEEVIDFSNAAFKRTHVKLGSNKITTFVEAQIASGPNWELKKAELYKRVYTFNGAWKSKKDRSSAESIDLTEDQANDALGKCRAWLESGDPSEAHNLIIRVATVCMLPDFESHEYAMDLFYQIDDELTDIKLLDHWQVYSNILSEFPRR